MKLRELIEVVLPTLVDDLEGYDTFELSLLATDRARVNELAHSIILISRTGESFTVTSSEVQVFEPTRRN